MFGDTAAIVGRIHMSDVQVLERVRLLADTLDGFGAHMLLVVLHVNQFMVLFHLPLLILAQNTQLESIFPHLSISNRDWPSNTSCYRHGVYLRYIAPESGHVACLVDSLTTPSLLP
jgi:hypothetical protein